jgi:hypothetical protein
VPESYQKTVALAASCDQFANLCQQMAGVARRKKKQHQALVRLMEPLCECYQRLFGREPRGGWRHKKLRDSDEADGPLNQADSPFIRFAASFCEAVDYQVRPATLQTALYDFRALQKKNLAAPESHVANQRMISDQLSETLHKLVETQEMRAISPDNKSEPRKP